MDQETSPRPNGFDFSQPDCLEDRCQVCNPDGMNRTGMLPVEPVGASVSSWYAIMCPARCRKGLAAKRDRPAR